MARLRRGAPRPTRPTHRGPVAGASACEGGAAREGPGDAPRRGSTTARMACRGCCRRCRAGRGGGLAAAQERLSRAAGERRLPNRPRGADSRPRAAAATRRRARRRRRRRGAQPRRLLRARPRPRRRACRARRAAERERRAAAGEGGVAGHPRTGRVHAPHAPGLPGGEGHGVCHDRREPRRPERRRGDGQAEEDRGDGARGLGRRRIPVRRRDRHPRGRRQQGIRRRGRARRARRAQGLPRDADRRHRQEGRARVHHRGPGDHEDLERQ